MEKIVDKSSNAYGRVLDAEGNQVDGEIPKEVPEGGKFVGAPMRYWMRLTWDGIGHHIGMLPRSRRACIPRLHPQPSALIPIIYDKVKIGTTVAVVD